jgi:dTDP-glucose 4,6-dehydratase
MKNIIVTGGSGFIGSNFIKLIIKKKYRIINIDKLTYASNKNFLKNLGKNYFFYKVDINNKKKIEKILKKYQPYRIFNFAAESHVDNSIKKSKNFILSNFLGVYNLLEILKSIKVDKNFRFVQISTDEVFGDRKGKKSSKETDAYMPSSPYSASKASADQLIMAWGRTYKINYNISYSSNNFGPNQHKEKFIPVILNSIKNNCKISVYGNGLQKREWTYVDDNVKAIFHIAFKGKKNECYNVSSSYSLNNLELINKIVKNYNKIKNKKINTKEIINYVVDRPGHDLRYSLNTKKLKKISFKKYQKFDHSISQTIKWYLKN